MVCNVTHSPPYASIPAATINLKFSDCNSGSAVTPFVSSRKPIIIVHVWDEIKLEILDFIIWIKVLNIMIIPQTVVSELQLFLRASVKL